MVEVQPSCITLTTFQLFKPILLIEILNEKIAQKLNEYFKREAYSFYNIDECKD